MPMNKEQTEIERLQPCPCGVIPQLVRYDRDRGLHPPMPNARYSCAKHGHILAAPWFEAGAYSTNETEQLEAGARKYWNNFITSIAHAAQATGHV